MPVHTRQERVVSEDFVFWLSPPAGTEHVAEAKIEVLRVGSMTGGASGARAMCGTSYEF